VGLHSLADYEKRGWEHEERVWAAWRFEGTKGEGELTIRVGCSGGDDRCASLQGRVTREKDMGEMGKLRKMRSGRGEGKILYVSVQVVRRG